MPRVRVLVYANPHAGFSVGQTQLAFDDHGHEDSLGFISRGPAKSHRCRSADSTESAPPTPEVALMEAPPLTDPVESTIERSARLEILRTAMDEALTPRERHVIDCMFSGRRLSLRSVAAEMGLGKTHVARIRDRAFDKIRVRMGNK